MFDVGKLMLGVSRKDGTVAATDIRSTRPMAAQVLKGKTPAQVMQIVPLLFSVCGRAQGAAAQAALQAAEQGGAVAAAEGERGIACEAMQEHLWRLLLDWPKLLGLPTQEQRFAAWYALLRKIGAGEVAMETFLHEFERDALGMPSAQWRAMATYAEAQAWWRQSASPLAQVLAALDRQGQGRSAAGAGSLLPAWTAAEAQQACAGKWDAAFAAHPHWQGAAAETGAWSYYADTPLLREVQQQSGSKALTRVLARVMDTAALADGSAAPRLDTASAEAGEGIAAVRTARGLLLHHVRLADGKVADYAIVAPTEWNFHPAGAFAQDMRGQSAADEAELRQAVQIEALSLDPCVAYEVEIKNGMGSSKNSKF